MLGSPPIRLPASKLLMASSASPVTNAKIFTPADCNDSADQRSMPPQITVSMPDPSRRLILSWGANSENAISCRLRHWPSTASTSNTACAQSNRGETLVPNSGMATFMVGVCKNKFKAVFILSSRNLMSAIVVPLMFCIKGNYIKYYIPGFCGTQSVVGSRRIHTYYVVYMQLIARNKCIIAYF